MTKILEIKQISNGYLLLYQNPNEEGWINEAFVIPDAETGSKEELIPVQHLLWQVLDILGYNWSKHNKYNIEIKVKKNI